MTFAIKDNDFVYDVLEDIGDTIILDVDRDDESGKEFIQLSFELPKEAYKKFGPESVEMIQKFIGNKPFEFMNKFFPGHLEDIEWGEAENEHMSIYEDNGNLKIVLNICCLIDDY